MADKEQQHIIPKTFLRRFEIPDFQSPNHVWCYNFEDKYTNKPKAKGVDSSIFKIKHFYTIHESSDKLQLENFFAEKVEPEYEKIYNEIKEENEISELIRIRIIEWIFYTNQRTDYLREQIKNTYEKLSEFIERFESNKKGIEFSKGEFDHKISSESKRVAKDIHLNTILDNETYSRLFTSYYDNLVVKNWTILKSNPDNPFIANDNPGFSINATKFYDKKPFHPTIHLNHPAFNYLVISPQYCLYMEPFKNNVPVKINALNMKIEYKTIANELINYINWGTYLTAKKYIISNKYNSIERWI
ncbi:MAG: DUF4238 domain-containing protein [Salinivirgaceae bacterium]|nr:DUF4238 domain-containing protein [Salinivirgaceae bacterium]